MDAWARFRLGRIDGGLGYPRQVLLGKIMDGMPGTNCPKCRGTGKVTIEAPGIAKMRADCPICEGAGKVRLDHTPSKANPAFITGNGPKTGYNDDPISQRVDWLVCTAITEDERAVVMAEFTWNGNRDRKITKLHIRHSTFHSLLDSAISKIEDGLQSA